MSTPGSSSAAGQLGKARATTVLASAPAMIWPSPPMLMTLARKATVMPTPTSSSGTALATVLDSSRDPPTAPLINAE